MLSIQWPAGQWRRGGTRDGIRSEAKHPGQDPSLRRVTRNLPDEPLSSASRQLHLHPWSEVSGRAPPPDIHVHERAGRAARGVVESDSISSTTSERASHPISDHTAPLVRRSYQRGSMTIALRRWLPARRGADEAGV